MDPRSQSNYKGAMMDCKKCVTHNGRSQVDHECFRDFPNPELVSSSEKTMSLSSEQSDESLDLKTMQKASNVTRTGLFLYTSY